MANKSVVEKEFLPEISILISSKNRREDLLKLLTSLNSLDYPKEKTEIVVVEETNNPLDIKGIKYIAIPEKNTGFGYTRNIAVKNASNEIIAFIDDDCIPERNWLRQLVIPLRDESVLGVAGAVKVRECNTIGYCENVLGFPGGGLKYIHRANRKLIPTIEISTLNAAYRKNTVIQAGGFDEEAGQTGGEDYLLAKLICNKNNCFYVPNAVVYHKVRGNFWKNLKWFVRRGKSDISILNKVENPQNRLLWILQSSIIVKIFIGTGIFYLLIRNLEISILLFFILYYMKNFYAYSFSYKYLKNLKVLFLAPILKLILDFGTDIGRLAYLLFEKKRFFS